MDGYSLITGGSSGSGSFAATTGYTAPTIPKNDFGAAVEAQGKYLYATFHTTEQIYGWTIGSGGGLTAISGMPLTLSFLAGVGYNSQGRTSLITNPAGTLLFLADSLSDQIYVYSIGSGGALTAVSGSPFSTGFSLQGLTTDGLGKYLYAIENGGFSGQIMPQNVVVGADATDVARFVATYAGRQAPAIPGTVSCEKLPVGTIPLLASAAATAAGSGRTGATGATGATSSAGATGATGTATTSTPTYP